MFEGLFGNLFGGNDSSTGILGNGIKPMPNGSNQFGLNQQFPMMSMPESQVPGYFARRNAVNDAAQAVTGNQQALFNPFGGPSPASLPQIDGQGWRGVGSGETGIRQTVNPVNMQSRFPWTGADNPQTAQKMMTQQFDTNQANSFGTTMLALSLMNMGRRR